MPDIAQLFENMDQRLTFCMFGYSLSVCFSDIIMFISCLHLMSGSGFKYDAIHVRTMIISDSGDVFILR